MFSGLTHRLFRNQPTGLQSRVLFSDPDDTSQIHLFTADVSRSYLDSLILLSKDTPADKLHIQHILVPYEPKETFRGRILHLITGGDEQQSVNCVGHG